MVVDAHIHVGAWDHPDFLGRTCTLAQTVEQLREADIDGACVMPSDQHDNAGLLADARATCDQRALWVLAWVRPVADGAPDDADPGAADLAWVEDNADALAGIKIHPSLSRARITDPGFAPVLDLARAADLMVLVHCGRWQDKASYRFAIEAAQAYPTVRFVLAHAGGDTPPLATAAADMVADRHVDNVWFEISGLREYWVTERNVRKLGADRYLLGSDFPLAHPRMYLGQIDAMDLPDSAKDQLRGGNARVVLGAPLGA